MDIFNNYSFYIKKYMDNHEDNVAIIGRGDNVERINSVTCGFDIETSTQYKKDNKGKVIEHYTNMYIWQCSIDKDTYYGRTWQDFHTFIECIKKYICKGIFKHLMFIHNNNFESSFMLRELQELGHSISVFARKARHPLKVVIDNKIIILDSYLLTGFSLEKLAKNYTTTQKLVGDLDYTLLRNSKTVLTNEELDYCRNDVQILSEYAQIYYDKYLSIGFLPMTSTMIASKVVKDKCKELKQTQDKFNLINKIYPQNQKQYNYIMSYYTGAYTHGMLQNLFKTHYNVLAYDVTSEYPFALMNYYYPMGKFHNISKFMLTNEKLMKNLLDNYCVLVDVTFENIRTKTGVTILSENKIKVENKNKSNIIFDNGRLYSNMNGLTTARLTEVDLITLSLHYEWDNITYNHGIFTERGKLPKYFRLAIAELYQLKDKLKYLVQQGRSDLEVELMESKKSLNGQYGSLCTKLPIEELVFTSQGWGVVEHINDFNKIRKSKYTAPQWAIYCTAWSRYLILSTVAKIKPSTYYYTDTDSIKCLATKENVKIFEDINKEIIKNNEVWINELGLRERYPNTDFTQMGTFTREKNIKKFKTLGSKRYICEFYDGKIESTIAGLSKKAFLDYCTKYNKNPFKVFSKNGIKLTEQDTQKLCAYYEDKPKQFIVEDYQGNIEEVLTYSYVSLIPTTFNLSITDKLLKVYEYEKDMLSQKVCL